MRTFAVAFSTELQKEISSIRHLLLISVSTGTTYCWTDCDQDVFFNGQKYTRTSFKFDAAQLSYNSKVDSVSFTFDNVDKSFSDLVLSTDNIQGRQVDLFRVALDSNIHVLGATGTSDAPLVFSGYIDKMEIDRRRARVSAYNHFIKWRTPLPRRQHLPTCQWVFQSTADCTYTSAGTSDNWCDKTWDRCTTLSNTTNFGGFRHITDLQSKEIMWGKVAKNFGVKK